jgi:hypothetical protein
VTIKVRQLGDAEPYVIDDERDCFFGYDSSDFIAPRALPRAVLRLPKLRIPREGLVRPLRISVHASVVDLVTNHGQTSR